MMKQQSQALTSHFESFWSIVRSTYLLAFFWRGAKVVKNATAVGFSMICAHSGRKISLLHYLKAKRGLFSLRRYVLRFLREYLVFANLREKMRRGSESL